MVATSTPAHEARKRRVQQEVGPDAEVVGLVLDLTKIDNDGVFVNVRAEGISALDTKLGFEVLGIAGVPKNLVMRIGSPSVGLLPDSYRMALRSPVNQAYGLLRKYGLQFMVAETYFGQAGHRWIPWPAFQKFELELNREIERFGQAKSNAVAHYDEIRTQMDDSLERLAVEAHAKLTKQGNVVEPGFVEKVKQALLDKMPTAEFIEQNMAIKREIGVLHMGSEIFEERARTAEAKLIETEANKETLAREAIINERARALKLEEDKKRSYLDQELRKEAEAKERIRQLKIDATKQTLEGAVSPIKEAAAQLSLTLNEQAKEMAASIQKNGYAHPRTAARVREMAEWFRLMNWTNDAEMDLLLTRLGEIASRTPAQRDPIQLSDALDQIIEATKKDAAQAAKSGRFAALEI